jgi:putative endonuclease
MEEWSIYILRCGDQSLYTGISIDVQRRIVEHTSGKKGAKYLKGKTPLSIVFSLVIGDKGKALKVEHRIKKLTKKDKEYLIQNPDCIKKLITDD